MLRFEFFADFSHALEHRSGGGDRWGWEVHSHNRLVYVLTATKWVKFCREHNLSYTQKYDDKVKTEAYEWLSNNGV